MIIKNKNNEIVKIFLVTKQETKASFREIVEYFSNKIESENLVIYGELPFLFTNDRAIYQNVEIKTTLECFDIYYRKIGLALLASKKLYKK